MTRALRFSAPLLAAALLATAAPAQEYKTAEQALSVGIAHARARDFEAARAPLEAAREMMLADRKEGTKKNPRADFALDNLHRALMATYAELGEAGPLFETGDWMLRNTDRPASRSMTARVMLGYARSKKDRDLLRTRYEAALKEDADDRIALRMLSDVAGAERTYDRAAELLGRVVELDAKTEDGADARDRVEHARLLGLADEHAASAKAYDALAAEAEKIEGDPTETFGPSSTAGNLHLAAARAWLEAGDQKSARTAADAAEAAGDAHLDDPHPYYFHDWLGDVWVELGEPAKAVPHFEKAVESTTIDGYRKSSRESLEKARAAAGK